MNLASLQSFSFQAYFEDNPRDFQALQHDKPLHAAKIQPELKNMPDYLGMYIDASFGGWAHQCLLIWWVGTSVSLDLVGGHVSVP